MARERLGKQMFQFGGTDRSHRGQTRVEHRVEPDHVVLAEVDLDQQQVRLQVCGISLYGDVENMAVVAAAAHRGIQEFNQTLHAVDPATLEMPLQCPTCTTLHNSYEACAKIGTTVLQERAYAAMRNVWLVSARDVPHWVDTAALWVQQGPEGIPMARWMLSQFLSIPDATAVVDILIEVVAREGWRMEPAVRVPDRLPADFSPRVSQPAIAGPKPAPGGRA